MPKPKAALILLAALAAAPSLLTAADVNVERLELLTRGAVEEGSGDFEVGTRLYFDLSYQGGEKFGAVLKLDFLSGAVERDVAIAGQDVDPLSSTVDEVYAKINNAISPRLKTVSVTARSVFDLPLDFSYFVGAMDALCAGDDFVGLFGTAPFATSLRGPMVYPDGVGGDPRIWYEGIHSVDGTGFRLSTTPKLWPGALAYAYFYQDSAIGPGYWSGDLRFQLNTPAVKLEAFAGVTGAGERGWYRTGFLFFAAPGDVGEFFIQAGLTRWDAARAVSLDDVYFLFEPRIDFGTGMAAVTVFYHPAYYLQRDFTAAGEKGALDAAFNLRFGRIAQDGAQGGLETLLAFRPLTSDPVVVPSLAVDASPYFSLMAGGIQWDFKLGIRAYPFPDEWYGIFRPFIGLKTSF
jgi:hypothetical protein